MNIVGWNYRSHRKSN